MITCIKVFGCKLTALCDYQGVTVPKFLVIFMHYIERKSAKCEDTYQTSGNPAHVKELRHIIEQGM